MCNITIDLGNIWDALSAIGTIGATGVALWLGLRKPKKKLDIVLLWDYVTKSKPVVYLSNSTSYIIAIKNIEIIYNEKRVAYMEITKNVASAYNGLISTNEIKEFVFENIDLTCVSIFDDSTDDLKHKLKVVVKDVYDNTYIKIIDVLEREIKIQKVGESMLNR